VERYRRDATLLVGVNSRDLETLRVTTGRLAALAPRLPTDVPRVAESGIESSADAVGCVRAGYQLALVGGALMKSAAPDELVAALLGAARAAVVPRATSSLCR
jgi:indole-3-glycerol phosphate synthase